MSCKKDVSDFKIFVFDFVFKINFKLALQKICVKFFYIICVKLIFTQIQLTAAQFV
jgi:hypothetical protein